MDTASSSPAASPPASPSVPVLPDRVPSIDADALRRADAPLPIPTEGGSTWVTRASPKVDRIACPWLVRRFVDPRARFVCLPEAEVLGFAARTGAIAFDLPGGSITHDGERCSFDTLCEAAGPQDAALSRLHADDDAAMLETAMPMYDALYAWSRDARHEPHRWQPGAAR
jgi:hypothetical protein